MMDLEKLGQLMIEHGLVIRAIPYEHTFTVEVRHQNQYPEGVIYYDVHGKRNMLRVTKKNPNGGKFIITQKRDTGTKILYWGKEGTFGEKVVFYDTIEEAVKSILE